MQKRNTRRKLLLSVLLNRRLRLGIFKITVAEGKICAC